MSRPRCTTLALDTEVDMFRESSRCRIAAAVSTLLILPPHLASGSSFGLLEQSASRLGTAFAGTGAAADDATTLFYNPAGLTQLESAEVTVVASGIYIDSSFEDEGSQPALGQPLGDEGGNAGGWNAVPSVYLALPFSETLAAGVAFNVPFGLSLDYGRDWIGRFQALRSEIQTYNFNPSIAWAPNESFSIGIGLNHQRAQAELTNAVNYSAVVAQGLQQLAAAGQLPPALVPSLVAANAGLEGTTILRGDDTAWGFNIGLLFVAPTGTRVGLSYRSALEYEIEGSVRFTPPTATNPIGAGIIAAASASGAPLANSRAAVDLELPDSAILSVQHPITAKFALLADAQWTGWSSIQELRVRRDTGEVISVTPERWKDSWRFALGATYELSPSLTLRAGVARDSTPVPGSTRTARLPDADRTWVALGARWDMSDAIEVNVGYAHLFSDDVQLQQNAGSTAANAFLIGEQASAVDIISVQAAYKF
jgi:long-chain fatty acid transport protein